MTKLSTKNRITIVEVLMSDLKRLHEERGTYWISCGIAAELICDLYTERIREVMKDTEECHDRATDTE